MAWEVCFWDRSGSDPTLREHAGQGGGWHLHPSWVTEAFPGVHTGHLGHLGSLMGNEVASGQGPYQRGAVGQGWGQVRAAGIQGGQGEWTWVRGHGLKVSAGLGPAPSPGGSLGPSPAWKRSIACKLRAVGGGLPGQGQQEAGRRLRSLRYGLLHLFPVCGPTCT